MGIANTEDAWKGKTMEQRLIDANAYAAELWKLRQNYQMLDDTHTADKIMHGLYRAEQVLKEQPTVDAVPVVRCEKCAYHSDIFLKGMEDFVWCDFFKVYRCKDSFCSCGRAE